MYYGIETVRPKIEVGHTQFLAMTTKGVYMHLSELRFCTDSELRCYVNIFKTGWRLTKKASLNFDFTNLDWHLVNK